MHRSLASLLVLTTGLTTACGEGRHEGEPCEEQIGEEQACGIDGVEVCLDNSETEEAEWSACYVDTCDKVDASQECSIGRDKGRQYCFETPSEDLRWGECIVEPACTVGDTEACGEPGVTMNCYLDEVGVPTWDFFACDTPLVLSFDGRAPAFAAPPAAARAFDISGSGACLDPDWPSAATPWLALDRDHNGSIDGGDELFGNGTRMSTGRHATQGFEALAELDSNGDGRISAADTAWSELVLWADHDGDRRSSGWELHPLAAYGVETIELDYHRDVICDERGNCGAERAAFTFRDGGRSRIGEVVDVYLACGE